jgi:hypothetical protein
MWEVKDKKSNLIVRYDFNTLNDYSVDDYTVTLVGTPCDEWREELYRRALNA